MSRMFFYRVYSLTIGSELPLPELPEAPLFPEKGTEPDVVIRLGKLEWAMRKATPHDELAIHNYAGVFHLIDGREIVVDPLPDADPDSVRVILIGRMMAYLLRQRGWLSLHGSGVSVGGEGLLFLGVSGSGKSTVAAAFHARGHLVITDDVAPVRVIGDQCVALPARARLRLHENSRSILNGEAAIPQWDKYLVDVTRGPLPEKIGVKRIYILAEGDRVDSTEIPPASAVRVLSAHSFFRRGRMDTESLRGHLRNCADVASTVAIRHLSLPRQLSSLPHLVDFVENEISNT